MLTQRGAGISTVRSLNPGSFTLHGTRQLSMTKRPRVSTAILKGRRGFCEVCGEVRSCRLSAGHAVVRRILALER